MLNHMYVLLMQSNRSRDIYLENKKKDYDVEIYSYQLQPGYVEIITLCLKAYFEHFRIL